MIKININGVFKNIRAIPVICVMTSVLVPIHNPSDVVQRTEVGDET
jgi:hypothetical protein